ncbi:hypothetical protein [Nocardia sp. alder85J]|uniref:hypothetical protein n=1 Tax=Nocardia sp. alder85J TaxID=2862949 RepID=UPI001CD58440|nr:hypothetical protein [Nocardia sp. alder85J]MCX4098367.1 hypothetical protein [Nocardia sp. alder85J]
MLQADGNSVLYDKDNKPHWASGTTNSKAKTLVLHDDSELELHNDNGQGLGHRYRTAPKVPSVGVTPGPGSTCPVLLHPGRPVRPWDRYCLQADRELRAAREIVARGAGSGSRRDGTR